MSDTESSDESSNESSNESSDESSNNPQFDYRWYEVETYDDLLKLNMEFIRGNLDMTPYHLGPLVIDVSSSNLMNNLIKLHEYGILTVDGQESLCEYNIEKNNKWYSREQRGNISFYINIEDNLELAESFIKQLKHKDNTLIYNIANIVTGYHITNISKDKCFNVTRSFSSSIKNQEIEWNYGTNFFAEFDCCDSWGDEIPKIYNILDNTIYFKIALPEYGKGNLEEVLLNMCEQNKLNKLYVL